MAIEEYDSILPSIATQSIKPSIFHNQKAIIANNNKLGGDR